MKKPNSMLLYYGLLSLMLGIMLWGLYLFHVVSSVVIFVSGCILILIGAIMCTIFCNNLDSWAEKVTIQLLHLVNERKEK